MKSFSQYLSEADKAIVFAFGRFNPPTIGHEKLIQKVASVARGNNYRIYPSQSQDKKKNPLSFNDKVKFMRKMFPKHGRNIMADSGVKNAFDVLSKLYDQGYNKVTMVAGSDRVLEFETVLNKYNGTKGRHGFYNFEGGVQVVSAGERDPDAEGVSGMSASKMREAAAKNDFNSFAKGLPPSYKEGQALFNAVRKGMGLKEEVEIKRHVELDKVSEVREAYVAGEILNEGDMVVITKTDEVAEVIRRGTNYVIIETINGNRLRKWLDDVELVERQDPDIKDREGTQPARYHSGLKKSTKVARDRQFKKQSKMDDDDPKAYKPAPGDASAETKPSKYTKIVKKMMDEKHTFSSFLELNEDPSKSFKKKSEKSGISVSTLRKVYNRGVAAWKTGHRPGTTPEQWGHARVNAFIAKKKKGNLNHDKDLA